MFRYRLVKFSNGEYGVAKIFLGLFTVGFVDLRHLDFSWNIHSQYFKDCTGTKEKAVQVLLKKQITWEYV